MKKIPLIIDCDPGVDDALAIILADSKECFDLKAITSVSGNVELEYTTYNLQLLKSLLKLQCPIAKGHDRPLVKRRVTAGNTHGSDGFGGHASLLKHLPLADLSECSAVSLIAKILRESEEKVVIAAVGPLTNIAVLIKAYPELLDKIEHLAIMGGGIKYGNITPTAEFNFYVDPEAAHIVFNSNLSIVMAGLDATLQAYVSNEDIEQLSLVKNEVSRIAITILQAYASNDSALHDPVAILSISNPEIFEFEDMHIQIETNEGLTRAMSFADQRHKKPKDNVKFITKVDRTKFIEEIKKSLEFYS